MSFSNEVLEAEKELIETRRWLHQHAEVSFHEYETTEYLEKALRALPGVTVERVTETGLVAHITGTGDGKPFVLGIRADIDALPMQEETPVPFASMYPGAMHACGHDGHAAILLTAVKLLSASRNSFCGEVRCFFQHAEELPPGGAIEMVRSGAAKGVDAMLSLHLSANFPTGACGVKTGTLTANVDAFSVTVHGKGGHCAFPEQCTDPVVAAAELVLQLQTIVSRRVPATESAVVSVCNIHGGTAYNIIPDTVSLNAAVRTFGALSRKHVRQEVERTVNGVAQANGLTCELQYDEGYPSVVNNPVLADIVRETVKKRFGEEHLLEIGSIMPGEDFSYFLSDSVPGFFLELGSGCKEKGCAYPHHNTRFCLDEDALLYGLQWEIDMVRTLLDGSGEIIGRAKACV